MDPSLRKNRAWRIAFPFHSGWKAKSGKCRYQIPDTTDSSADTCE